MDKKNKIPSKPKILLAEDNEINRKLITYVLKSKGLVCDIAVNGEEALTACLEKDYDIVFMDCQMPLMDGYESTLKIREKEGDKKHVIIIAMTANTMEDSKEKCLEFGMDDYISKPIDFDAMLDMIEKYKKSCMIKNLELLEESVGCLAQDTGFSKKDARELIYEFMNYLPETLETISEALENKNYEEVRKLAHQIKGTSANLRIKILPDLAMRLQKFSEEKDIDECKKILIDVKKIFE